MLYRAFFAIRELSTRSGRPTNAVFGLIRMLEQMRRRWQPTHWLVVFDGGLPADRLDLAADYKAQRPAMPDALRSQMEPAEEYLDRAGIAWMRREGQEADDVIASLAAHGEREAKQVLIATGDKDLFQVVTETTRVVPLAGAGTAMGPAEVAAKTGVRPSEIVAWLALAGDATDNIRGVPGVGRKTAAALIRKHGSLKALWEHLEEVPGRRVREALAQHRDIVERNVQVVRLNRALPCEPDWEKMLRRPPDAAALISLFEELEFASMARALRQGELFEDPK